MGSRGAKCLHLNNTFHLCFVITPSCWLAGAGSPAVGKEGCRAGLRRAGRWWVLSSQGLRSAAPTGCPSPAAQGGDREVGRKG